jgi:hypothetical protein
MASRKTTMTTCTETFNGTLGGTFGQTVYIVNNSFGTGALTDCPATAIWRDDNQQYEDFVNYLMWDSTGGNDSFVFGTIIENKDDSNKTDISCYNGDICDFQILVAEDGHGTDTASDALLLLGRPARLSLKPFFFL